MTLALAKVRHHRLAIFTYKLATTPGHKYHFLTWPLPRLRLMQSRAVQENEMRCSRRLPCIQSHNRCERVICCHAQYRECSQCLQHCGNNTGCACCPTCAPSTPPVLAFPELTCCNNLRCTGECCDMPLEIDVSTVAFGSLVCVQLQSSTLARQ